MQSHRREKTRNSRNCRQEHSSVEEEVRRTGGPVEVGPRVEVLAEDEH